MSCSVGTFCIRLDGCVVDAHRSCARLVLFAGTIRGYRAEKKGVEGQLPDTRSAEAGARLGEKSLHRSRSSSTNTIWNDVPSGNGNRLLTRNNLYLFPVS